MKTYTKPLLRVHLITGVQHLLQDSIAVGEGKVDDPENIGFVKDNNNRGNHSVWDDDWSKQ